MRERRRGARAMGRHCQPRHGVLRRTILCRARTCGIKILFFKSITENRPTMDARQLLLLGMHHTHIHTVEYDDGNGGVGGIRSLLHPRNPLKYFEHRIAVEGHQRLFEQVRSPRTRAYLRSWGFEDHGRFVWRIETPDGSPIVMRSGDPDEPLDQVVSRGSTPVCRRSATRLRRRHHADDSPRTSLREWNTVYTNTNRRLPEAVPGSTPVVRHEDLEETLSKRSSATAPISTVPASSCAPTARAALSRRRSKSDRTRHDASGEGFTLRRCAPMRRFRRRRRRSNKRTREHPAQGGVCDHTDAQRRRLSVGRARSRIVDPAAGHEPSADRAAPRRPPLRVGRGAGTQRMDRASRRGDRGRVVAARRLFRSGPRSHKAMGTHDKQIAHVKLDYDRNHLDPDIMTAPKNPDDDARVFAGNRGAITPTCAGILSLYQMRAHMLSLAPPSVPHAHKDAPEQRHRPRHLRPSVPKEAATPAPMRSACRTSAFAVHWITRVCPQNWRHRGPACCTRRSTRGSNPRP